jgi:threonine/homoserine/homoserine lactone efflux protein
MITYTATEATTEIVAIGNFLQIAGAVFVLWLIWRLYNDWNRKSASDKPGMGS